MIVKVELSVIDLKKLIAEHLGAKPESVSFIVDTKYDYRGSAYGGNVRAEVLVDYKIEKKQ